LAGVSVAGLAFAGSTTASADDSPENTFKTNCAACHGPDGSGDTPIGQSLKAADLRSPEVQKLTNAEITDQIANGKGKMPPFKAKLNADQIKGLVGYVREFGKKKKK